MVYASERVVLASVPSEIWHQNIYLMADQITWMDYENFAVQVGDMGQMIYHFPKWYHGKYEPKLFELDLSGDTFDDKYKYLNPSEPFIVSFELIETLLNMDSCLELFPFKYHERYCWWRFNWLP